MADIIINEISQNYTYVVGNDSFATVALPITASWGPGYFEPNAMSISGETRGDKKNTELEDVVWQRFQANQQGMEAFVSMYRGAANNYRLAKDYSYQMAMTLMSNGYDVLVCRLNPGSYAEGAVLRDVSKDETHTSSLKYSSAKEYILPEVKRESQNLQEAIELPVPLTVRFKTTILEKSVNDAGEETISEREVECTDDGKGRFIDETGNYITDTDGNDVTIDYNTSKIENLEIKSGSTVEVTYNTEYYKSGKFHLKAKYPGSYGNRLACRLTKMRNRNCWNLIVYMIDSTGVKYSVENKTFTFDIENSTDSVLHIDEIESDYVEIEIEEILHDNTADFRSDGNNILFSGGTDRPSDDCYRFAEDPVDPDPVKANQIIIEETQKKIRSFYKKFYNLIDHNMYDEYELDASGNPTGTKNVHYIGPVNGVNQDPTKEQILMEDAIRMAKIRYDYVMNASDSAYNSMDATQKDGMLENTQYIQALRTVQCDPNLDLATASTRRYQEWLYTEVQDVYNLLLDRLTYAPNRIISPGWDDQDILSLVPDADVTRFDQISPLHHRLMYVAYYSRCATAYLDTPRSMQRKYVYNDSQDASQQGYAQMLARYDATSDAYEVDGTLYSTHSALFGPWGTYKYVGTGKYLPANPGFLALLIQRSMIKNQSLQYEWIQPSTRTCNVKIGKMDYTVPQKILDLWQPQPDQEGGCGVNAIGDIPSLGLSIWGDSTCYENPPAVYQALRNLSNRLIVNALKNQSYKTGLSITWNYNNESAYAKFYVGMTPLCDTMRNAGAIQDYYIYMAADLDKVGAVKANSCVGKIVIITVGTIQNITIDLIALPPGSAIDDYTAK